MAKYVLASLVAVALASAGCAIKYGDFSAAVWDTASLEVNALGGQLCLGCYQPERTPIATVPARVVTESSESPLHIDLVPGPRALDTSPPGVPPAPPDEPI